MVACAGTAWCGARKSMGGAASNECTCVGACRAMSRRMQRGRGGEGARVSDNQGRMDGWMGESGVPGVHRRHGLVLTQH